MPIIRFLIRRTCLSLSLMLGTIVVSFLLFSCIPGDPARVMLGPYASESDVARLSQQLGTDRPLPEQLKNQLKNISTLHWGNSIATGKSVLKETTEKFAVTAKVGLLGALIALAGSYILNLLVYFRPASKNLLSIVYLAISAPTFFTGTMAALLVGVWLPLVPLSASSSEELSPMQYLVPALIVSLYPLALMTKILSAKIAQFSKEPFYKAALSFGFSPWYVFHKFLLRPSLVSWLSAWSNQLSVVFVASFVVEVIFTIPGIGMLLVSTIQRKDYPVLQGILILNAGFFVAVSWLFDTLFLTLDPRVKRDASA